MIKHWKTFTIGATLTLIFICMEAAIFSPLMKGQNMLQFADNNFNMLAKGSSYFIPKVLKNSKEFKGKHIDVAIKIDKKKYDPDAAVTVLTAAGARASIDGKKLNIKGDLGKMLEAAIRDSDDMYNNNGKAISQRYGIEEKTAMKAWWFAFDMSCKALKKAKLMDESNILDEVNKKALEPSYNFYKIDAKKVSKNAGLLSALLLFYVFYTLLWGFAIYYLFDGLGLSMSKAKVKAEV